MAEQTSPINSDQDNISRWAKIGITAGIIACVSYPLMILVNLPRIPQVTLGGSFGPALAIASIALTFILQSRRKSPTTILAAAFNSLAGALVTAMIIVQLAINYSTTPAVEAQLSSVLREHIWNVVLGLDVAFDIFIGLGTFFFAMNFIRDPRFGKIIGWTGIFVALVPILGANIYYFPDPPYVHGFPHVGIFTGLWYLGVVFLMIKSLLKDQLQ